ncbi:MAG TPA: diguanylate cyclase [Candidatus Limnocylindrales bacterium]|nr:diguanylate cyclase [Candidatus Limnocylindrales bacterium]
MSNRTILIVDDNETVCNLLKAQLQAKGFPHVLTAFNGSEALDVIVKQTPDLIISDIHMPVLDGYQLCRVLKSEEFREYNHIPVILISKFYQDSDAERQAREVGAIACLQVPYQEKALLDLIHNKLTTPTTPSLEQVRYKGKLLIAENDPEVARTLEQCLVKHGYQVAVVEDGIRAMNYIKNQHPELILLDFQLPELSGIEILKWIKTEYPEILIIVMTNFVSEQTAVELFKAGADEYLRKPFDAELVPIICDNVFKRANIRLISKQFEKRANMLAELYQKEKEARRREEEKTRKLMALMKATQFMTSSLNLDQVLNSIIRLSQDFIYGSECSLMLLTENQELKVVASTADFEGWGALRIRVGEGLPGWVIENKETLVVPDLLSDARCSSYELARAHQFKCYLGIPLQVKEKIIGVLNVYAAGPGSFSEEDIHLLQSFANQAGIAIENAQLYEREQRDRQIQEKLAITDGLTGIPNHRHLQDFLAKEFERARRYMHPLSLIMLDIDSFKNINDTCGHEVGDLVLKEIAKLLAISVREVDLVARYGGEEFAIVLPETSLESAFNTAERLRLRIERSKIQTPKGELQVTISLGISCLKASHQTKDELISAADEALYRAKRGGKNRVELQRE